LALIGIYFVPLAAERQHWADKSSMPVTPFHFGPGTLLKACAPRFVSLTAFIISQGLIDIESGYHLLWSGWPLHREVHSLPVSGLVGLFAGTVIWFVGRRFRWSSSATLRSEFDLKPAILGGLIGGLSHPFLDAVMHSDLQPFWPVSAANPFLAAVSLGYLHALCLASGIAGIAILAVRSHLAGKAG
jgi:membrane-bound metal-dependent hydrolase YbcI (DUF457 family)